MIGVDSIEPNTPPLVIVYVPPVSSSIGELAVLRALAEIGDLLLDLGDRQLVGVAQDRHDQAARAADGDADVEVAVIDDVVAVDRRVDHRELLQRVHRRLDEEAHEAELDAVLLLEALLVPVAQVDHRLHVDFVERGEDRGGRLRLHEALGDALAQARHRHALLGPRARARPGRPDGAGGAARAPAPAGAAAARGLPRGFDGGDARRPW